MGRKQISLLLLLLPIVVIYNNCAPSSSDLSGAGFSSVGFNSFAESFKSSGGYEYFDAAGDCATSQNSASLILSINSNSGTALIQPDECLGSAAKTVDFNAWKFQPFNPFLIYYDNKVFAHPELRLGISNPLYYQEYCFNESQQMTFTIQYLRPLLSGGLGQASDWIGVTHYGEGAKIPGLYFNGGTVDMNSDGSKTFTADNDLISVEMSAEYEVGKRSALYQKKDGQVVSMLCWVNHP